MPLNKLLNRKKKSKLHTHTLMQVYGFTYRNKGSSNYDYFYFGIPFQPLTICLVLQPRALNQPFMQRCGCLNLQFIIKSHTYEIPYCQQKSPHIIHKDKNVHKFRAILHRLIQYFMSTINFFMFTSNLKIKTSVSDVQICHKTKIQMFQQLLHKFRLSFTALLLSVEQNLSSFRLQTYYFCGSVISLL